MGTLNREAREIQMHGMLRSRGQKNDITTNAEGFLSCDVGGQASVALCFWHFIMASYLRVVLGMFVSFAS